LTPLLPIPRRWIHFVAVHNICCGAQYPEYVAVHNTLEYVAMHNGILRCTTPRLCCNAQHPVHVAVHNVITR